MKITPCKLLRKHQLKLLEYFVLEVTARSAAEKLGIQSNTEAEGLNYFDSPSQNIRVRKVMDF